MSEETTKFELSSEEFAFLRRLASSERRLEYFLAQEGQRIGGKHTVLLGKTDSENLGGLLTELLAKVGFGMDYSPNEQGQVLERLIDRFYCR